MRNFFTLFKLFGFAMCVCWCANSEAVAGKLAQSDFGTSARLSLSKVSPRPEGGFQPSGVQKNIRLAQSTINPNIPAQGSALSSQPIRNNFQAAANDINALYGLTTNFVSLNVANLFTAPQTFTNSDLILLGSSLGYTTFTSSNSSATNYVLTIPPVTGTAAVLSGSATAANSVVTTDSLGSLSLTTTLPAGLTIGGSGVATAASVSAMLNTALPNIATTQLYGGSGAAGRAQAFTAQVPIALGGTGQATASAAFNALSPMTTAGDIIYGGTSGAGTRLPAGTANQMFIGGTVPSWSSTLPAGLTIGGSGVATAASVSAMLNTALPNIATTQLYGGSGAAGVAQEFTMGVGVLGNTLGTAAPSTLTTLPAGLIAPSLAVPIRNVSGSNSNTTGTCTAGSNVVTLTSAIDFVNGQGWRGNHCGIPATVTNPTSPTVTPAGTTGSTTYSYELVSLDAHGGYTAATSAFQTTTGNATLSAANYNGLAWTGASGGAQSYAIYKSIASVYTLIGITSGTSFRDYGQTSFGPTIDWLPSIAPSAAANDWLVTTISSGAGTTTLTLAASATTSASSTGVYHDDTAALQTAITNNRNPNVIPGYYHTTSTISIPANTELTGSSNDTVILNVVPNEFVLTTSNADSVHGFILQLLPGQIGIFMNGNVIEDVYDVMCSGPGQCININNSSYITLDKLFLNGWGASTPATIYAYGSSGAVNLLHISHTQVTNDGAQVMSGPSIWLYNVYNATIMSSGLNSNGYNDGASGINVDGGSQAINMVGNQILNYTSDIAVNGSSLGVSIVSNMIDYPTPNGIMLASGSFTTITGNEIVGETTTNEIGINVATTYSGPITVSGNNFNGFSKSGDYPIYAGNSTVAALMYASGNTYSNNAANINNFVSLLDGSPAGTSVTNIAVTGSSIPAAGAGFYARVANTTGDLSIAGGNVLEYSSAQFFPNSNNTVSLGIAGHTWSALYITAGTGTNQDFLCLSSAGLVLIQSSACTISSMRFKEDIQPFEASALAEIAMLRPVSFKMRPGETPNADPNFLRTQLGLTAENVANVDPRMAIYEDDLVTPKSYRQESIIALLVKGEQELKAANDNMQACLDSWQCRIFGRR